MRVSRTATGRLWNETGFGYRGHLFGKPWNDLSPTEREYVQELVDNTVQYVEALQGLPDKAGDVIIDVTVEVLDSTFWVPVMIRDENGMWHGVDSDGTFRGFVADFEILDWRPGTVQMAA